MLLYFSLCRPKWIHSERQLLRGHVWHGFENITSESKNAATFKGLQLAFMLFNNASESIIPMAFLAYCFKVLFDWVLWDLLYKSQRLIGSIVEISKSQWELNVNSRNQPREHLSANVQVFGGFVFFGVWRESSRPITERRKKTNPIPILTRLKIGETGNISGILCR